MRNHLNADSSWISRLLILAAIAAALAALAGCGVAEDEPEAAQGSALDPEAQADASAAALAGRPFAEESPWNTPIDTLAVDPESEAMLELALVRHGIQELESAEAALTREVDDGLAINTRAWAPLVVPAEGPETELVCRQSDCWPAGDPVTSLPIPAEATPDPAYDGWLSVLDQRTGTGYDFWRARRESDGSISYQFAKAWDLAGPGFSRPASVAPTGATSARGSGLPLFAGTVSAAELESGVIDHALAIAVPGLAQRYYVPPASATNGSGDLESLPAGARIRLRADADIAIDDLPYSHRRYADTIVEALRRYGAIVVDTAVVPTLYAQRGDVAAAIRGDELSSLNVSDFEVVQLPEHHRYPPLDAGGRAGS